MTVSTLRPDGTSSSSSVTVTGAASAHAALNDNSDSSYLTVANTGQLVVTMGNLTLPAGAVIKSGQLRFRGARTSAGTSVVRFRAGDVAPYALPATDFSVTWTSPTTVSAGATFETSNLTDAKADALLIAVIGASPSDTVSIRFYELYVDYTYVTVPTTAVTVGGTITDTNLPEVTWSNTLDSDGGAQTTYEVKVFTDAQYLAGGFDPDTSSPFETSGQTSSAAAAWTPTDPQPDDTYRAYVRVAQTVNGSLHWSDWAYDEYVISVDLPATPTIAVYAEANEGRHRIEIRDTPGGAATTDDFELQVSTDGGTTYTHVRGLLADGIITPEAGSTIVYDWEAPNGTLATYRVRARHDYSGVYAASAWASDSDTWTSSDWWIKNPVDPSQNMVVEVHSQVDRNRPVRQGTFQALGATYPVVITDTRAAAAGTIVLRTDDEADQTLLDDLLDSGVTLLVQAPATDHWPDRYVRFGDHGRARIADKAFVEPVFDTLPWQQVAAPTGLITEYPADAS